MQPKIIIHGGFFSESSQSEDTKIAKQNTLKEILIKANSYLADHSALQTVVYAVSLLENDILFNAGTGSQIQSDGEIRMSASLMDGITQKFSGVINIQHIQNPIMVAKHLMAYDDRVLGGTEATSFAHQNGFQHYNPEIPQRRAEYEAKKAGQGIGTVGCVALDQQGHLAVATSTGGKGFEIPGRISDSATVAGNFANKFCAVSCTGVGEDIVSGAVATKIVTRVTDGLSIEKAFERSFEELKPFDGFAGAIGIDHSGNIFHQYSHPKIVFAYHDGEKIVVFE
ncbi:MAG: isoaspartyl peptidase/L-asparaginase [Raineya sp.]|jgi:L-asparaginase|nr:isoaspartyl peptidase/L-asparaginase [Raineya sp.]